MKLTGKCKQDFENWFVELNICQPEGFCTWTLSMQFGVIQDFADSKGIDLDVKIGIDLKTDIRDGYDYSAFNYMGWCPNRNEAREQVIIKFNEIYNEIK